MFEDLVEFSREDSLGCFSFSWEQRKLGDLCESFDYGLNAAAKEYDGKNKYIRITDIDDDTRSFLKNDITSPEADLSHADHYKLRDGDIVFARTGASVGKTYLYDSKEGTVYFAGFLIRAKVKKDQSPEFLFQATLTDFYRRYIAITSQRSGQPGVNASEYQAWEVTKPVQGLEQVKIGSLFESIDRLITLHQRNYHLYQNKLAFFLPKEAIAWEQRELGENCEITTGGTPTTSNSDYWNPKEIPWLSSGEVHKKRISATDDKISRLGLENSSARWVKPCSVLVALAGQGKTRGTVAINEIALTTNQSIAAIYPEEHDAEFLFQNLESRYEELRAISSADGSRGGLNKHLLSAVTIPYAETREQQKIGIFFRDLDSLITLHQREYLLPEVLLCSVK